MPRKAPPGPAPQEMFDALRISNGHNFIERLAPGGLYVDSSNDRWTGGWVVTAPGRRLGRAGQVGFSSESRRLWSREEAQAFASSALGVGKFVRRRIGPATYYLDDATWERGLARAREMLAERAAGAPAATEAG